MLKFSTLALILGLTGAMAGLPSSGAAQTDPDAAGIAEAIRFEKAKQAAADRQARIEDARALPGAKSEKHSAPASKTKAQRVKNAAAVQKTPPAQHYSQ